MARGRCIALVLGLEPLPCETLVIGDPDQRLVRVWCCPGYAVCLDAACRLNWKSWTCRACPIFDLCFKPPHTRIVRKVVP